MVQFGHLIDRVRINRFLFLFQQFLTLGRVYLWQVMQIGFANRRHLLRMIISHLTVLFINLAHLLSESGTLLPLSDLFSPDGLLRVTFLLDHIIKIEVVIESSMVFLLVSFRDNVVVTGRLRTRSKTFPRDFILVFVFIEA